MIIRQDFCSELPPKAFLYQVLDDLAKVYVFLWENKNPKNVFTSSWEELTKVFSKNNFRSCIRKLTEKGLVNCDESHKNIIVIEMVRWDEVS